MLLVEEVLKVSEANQPQQPMDAISLDDGAAAERPLQRQKEEESKCCS